MPENSNKLIENLEAAGITFAAIPEGTYRVGYDGDKAVLAQPPHHSFVKPTVTPPMEVDLSGFYITKDVLRLSHWQNVVAQDAFPGLKNLLSQEDLSQISEQKRLLSTVFVEQPASEVQWHGTSLEPLEIPSQPEPDPALSVSAETAEQIAQTLNASLPRWDEWEAATRGTDGRLYPWGNELDPKLLSLEYQDFSIEDEGVMGYYRYDQELYFVHSFGPYVDQPSPFGLTGLARPGREWNLTHQGLPVEDDHFVLRSISDLGGMAMMIPGLMPNTWGMGNWFKTKKHLAFSGPVLPCYAKANVGEVYHRLLYPTAAFRLVIRRE